MTKVLLVEDDTNLSEIYKARLEAEGFQVFVAKDGEEGLMVAKANQPDLLISDVMMPRVSGMEMLEIIKSSDSLKNMKVIMLTALNQDTDEERAKGLGADKYLVKSQVTLEDIISAVHDLLGDANAANTADQAAPAIAPEPMPTMAPEMPAAPVATPAPTDMPAPSMETPASSPEPMTAPESPSSEPIDFGGKIEHDETATSAPVDLAPPISAPVMETPAPSTETMTTMAPEMPAAPVATPAPTDMPAPSMETPTPSAEPMPTTTPEMPAAPMTPPTEESSTPSLTPPTPPIQ